MNRLFATILPIVLGGASTLIKCARATDDAVDVAKTTENVADKATDVVKTGKTPYYPETIDGPSFSQRGNKRRI